MIVITGAESFIGKVLRRQLDQRGLPWLGLDTVTSGAANIQVADITDPDSGATIPAGTDALIHLAAISRGQDCQADMTRACRVNLEGTVNLIAAAKLRGVKQIVFASSEWVYGQTSGDTLQREDDAIDIRTLGSEYAVTKLTGESFLRFAVAQGGLAATVLRFGIVYGPRPANWSAVESLFNAVRLQDEVSVGCLKTARRFIHVEDIATGIIASIGQSGFNTFNLSGDRLITLGQVIEASALIHQRQPRRVEKQPGQADVRNPCNQKAREILRWSPQIDLEAGLRTLL